MKLRCRIVAALMFTPLAVAIARGQAKPTATEDLRVSVFAGATGTYTGLAGGKNLGFTAGADLGIHSFFGLEPSLEVRGTYPIHDGPVDAQENVLGGLTVSKRYGRFHLMSMPSSVAQRSLTKTAVTLLLTTASATSNRFQTFMRLAAAWTSTLRTRSH